MVRGSFHWAINFPKMGLRRLKQCYRLENSCAHLLFWANMVSKPRPIPGFLCGCVKFQVKNNIQIWTNAARTRFFTWDHLHGEIEAFDKRGNHLGAFDGVTGVQLKEAIRGRKL